MLRTTPRVLYFVIVVPQVHRKKSMRRSDSTLNMNLDSSLRLTSLQRNLPVRKSATCQMVFRLVYPIIRYLSQPLRFRRCSQLPCTRLEMRTNVHNGQLQNRPSFF